MKNAGNIITEILLYRKTFPEKLSRRLCLPVVFSRIGLADVNIGNVEKSTLFIKEEFL